tara:strand:- start:790 stop:1431 length:642 start_codon:yes stop_codon:yes gene_type:complete
MLSSVRGVIDTMLNLLDKTLTSITPTANINTLHNVGILGYPITELCAMYGNLPVLINYHTYVLQKICKSMVSGKKLPFNMSIYTLVGMDNLLFPIATRYNQVNILTWLFSIHTPVTNGPYTSCIIGAALFSSTYLELDTVKCIIDNQGYTISTVLEVISRGRLDILKLLYNSSSVSMQDQRFNADLMIEYAKHTDKHPEIQKFLDSINVVYAH